MNPPSRCALRRVKKIMVTGCFDLLHSGNYNMAGPDIFRMIKHYRDTALGWKLAAPAVEVT